MKELRKGKVEVSVAVGNGSYRKTHTFIVARDKLPAAYNTEGLMLTVKEEDKKPEKPKKESPPAPSDARRRRYVEITLPPAQRAAKPTWERYGVLTVPKEIRKFFPKYKEEFLLRTSRGEFSVRMAAANDHERDPYRGTYISGMTGFFKAHSDLTVGDTLIFTKAGSVMVDGAKMRVYEVSFRPAQN